MRRFIFDRWAVVWRTDGRCELYLSDVTTIDRLRVQDLVNVGLPDETMCALWRQAQAICARADATGVPELLHSPYLFWIDHAPARYSNAGRRRRDGPS